MPCRIEKLSGLECQEKHRRMPAEELGWRIPRFFLGRVSNLDLTRQVGDLPHETLLLQAFGHLEIGCRLSLLTSAGQNLAHQLVGNGVRPIQVNGFFQCFLRGGRFS